MSKQKDIKYYALLSIQEVYQQLNVTEDGYNDSQVDANRKKYGNNQIINNKNDSLLTCLQRAFLNPFSIILFSLGVISVFIDIFLSEYRQKNWISVYIIFTMLLVSGLTRMIQEMRSKKKADTLVKSAKKQSWVLRDKKWILIDSSELVVGDTIRLNSGDKIAADVRVIKAEDLTVSQSVITGESLILEKNASKLTGSATNMNEYTNIVFSSTTITGGSGLGVVIAVGNNTVYGSFDLYDSDKRRKFDKGENSIALVLIKYMLVLVPIVFFASGITQNDWNDAFIFAVSIAVGLTPELLALVVNACLAKGSYSMNQKQTIVKNINAMQGFGSMDTLCVDKTGTLTGDTILLEYYTDVFGNESQKTLDYGYLASYYQKENINHIDSAILNVKSMPNQNDYYNGLVSKYHLVDKMPFDYNKRIGNVVIDDGTEKFIIIKGSVDEIVSQCNWIEYKNNTVEIENDSYSSVHSIVDEMLEDGMKVIAVAYRKMEQKDKGFVLLGYLAFFDAPKKSAESAISKLKELNVNVKVLTGDNLLVTKSICNRLRISTDKYLTGKQIDSMSYVQLNEACKECNIFAELSPKQKSLIIDTLQKNDHTVGYLGDGMNDLPAMLQADVGISVENAVQAVKESANVILLKKDLNVLEEGILEGRKAFANMTKYIKITASSNFGNICAIVVASVLLPFFPMTSIQLLLLNLLYDILCLALPWDNVDEDMITLPLEWSGKTLGGFMRYFGPLSSLFDIITYLFLFFVLCPMICGGRFDSISLMEQEKFISIFQTGWFLESLWTQVLIIQLLRTKRFPFVNSKPGKSVIVVTVVGLSLLSLLPITSIGRAIGLTKMPIIYYLYLVLVVSFYLLVVTIAKVNYVKKHNNLM